VSSSWSTFIQIWALFNTCQLLRLYSIISDIQIVYEYRALGEIIMLGENLSQCHFVHHKSSMHWPGIKPRPPQWQAGNSPDPWHGPSAAGILLPYTWIYSPCAYNRKQCLSGVQCCRNSLALRITTRCHEHFTNKFLC